MCGKSVSGEVDVAGLQRHTSVSTRAALIHGDWGCLARFFRPFLRFGVGNDRSELTDPNVYGSHEETCMSGMARCSYTNMLEYSSQPLRNMFSHSSFEIRIPTTHGHFPFCIFDKDITARNWFPVARRKVAPGSPVSWVFKRSQNLEFHLTSHHHKC